MRGVRTSERRVQMEGQRTACVHSSKKPATQTQTSASFHSNTCGSNRASSVNEKKQRKRMYAEVVYQNVVTGANTKLFTRYTSDCFIDAADVPLCLRSLSDGCCGPASYEHRNEAKHRNITCCAEVRYTCTVSVLCESVTCGGRRVPNDTSVLVLIISLAFHSARESPVGAAGGPYLHPHMRVRAEAGETSLRTRWPLGSTASLRYCPTRRLRKMPVHNWHILYSYFVYVL